ncbi:helix-turn-helix domain-containing protein [Synechocystis sp. PCC 6714]|jgi:transcriptional regulator with XRE-family HTH domain|uniref:helix-turn-helix domain-containing protein n=1 Tax=Synechocystis sp. (strain PCC 6714) TaxID=1147 RepID=UPI00048AD4C4|nr:helix-turn-helix transcriptional regulator [Synechocystis sp. PCC 6714]
MSLCIEILREKVRKYRLSQKLIADVANRSETNISQVLAGKSVPSVESFEQILDACDKIKPGFKCDYWRSMAGNNFDLQEFVYSLSSVEFGMLLMIAGQRVQEKQGRANLVAS